MATPILERRTLRGARGNILIDVRGASDRAPRPAVVILPGSSGLEDRLARGGFTAVSPTQGDIGEPVTLSRRPERSEGNAKRRSLADLESVLAALDRGELGVPPPTSIGMVAPGQGGDTAIVLTARTPRIAALVTGETVLVGEVASAAARVRVPWLRLHGTWGENGLDQTTAWLVRHLP